MKIIDTRDREALAMLSSDQQHWVYNGLDVVITAQVKTNLEKNLDEISEATYRHAINMQAPVMEMMLRGLPVDMNARDKIRRGHEKNLARVEAQLNKLLCEGIGYHGEFNPRSHTQVKDLFYNVLNLPVIKKKNSKGFYAPAADRETLEKLSAQHFFARPLVSHILLARDLSKAIGFLKTKADKDKHIRCNFNLAGTNTGRLSSSVSDFGTGTNLQNIDPANRGIFHAPRGRKFVNIDLEQADSRGVGAIAWNFFVESHGPEWAGAYLDACESGDLHTQVCRMAWPNLDWPEDRAGWRAIADQKAYREHSYRDLAKKLGHGTNYLGQPFTMSMHSKVPVDQIKEFQANYFAAFHCVKAWQDETIRLLQTTGHLINLFGRRRYFFGRHNDTSVKNAAIAYSPQGTTGDAINKGIQNLWRHKDGKYFQLHIQVHDSILLSIPDGTDDELIPLANELMRVPIELAQGREFIIPVDAQLGWNWGYASDSNPNGLINWTGKDDRRGPGLLKPYRRTIMDII